MKRKKRGLCKNPRYILHSRDVVPSFSRQGEHGVHNLGIIRKKGFSDAGAIDQSKEPDGTKEDETKGDITREGTKKWRQILQVDVGDIHHPRAHGEGRKKIIMEAYFMRKDAWSRSTISSFPKKASSRVLFFFTFFSPLNMCRNIHFLVRSYLKAQC